MSRKGTSRTKSLLHAYWDKSLHIILLGAAGIFCSKHKIHSTALGKLGVNAKALMNK
jgi:hypothetical protein